MPHSHVRRVLTSRSLVVAGVAFVAGLLFATSATVFAGSDDSRPGDLRSLVREESERLDARNLEVEELRLQVSDLQDSLAQNIDPATPAMAIAVGLEPVTGPGVKVMLSDAPSSATSSNPDDLVVHQQDLQAVVNALWLGGADAISIQGQRVVSTTAVRCVGNVLLLHGRTYSPPYLIEAVGDPKSLISAVEKDDSVDLFLQYVDAYGLGWSLSEEKSLLLPAYTGTRTLSFASPLEESA